MSIFLVPTLFFLLLVLLATRVRRQIEPACPSCANREWQSASNTLACTACGWSTGARIAIEPEPVAA